MARRSLTFGMRLRDRERDETLRIRHEDGGAKAWLVEREGRGRAPQRVRHDSLAEAVRDGARRWRARLN